MPSLSAFFDENKPLALAIMFAALLVLIIVLFLLYRFIFGRRLKATSGGRARQPRLGIVDAFDLDRQRQLVLVRRDNVEHLIMIGGPNDVVIEAAIVRTQSVSSMSPARDKEGVFTPSASAPQLPTAVPLSVPPQTLAPLPTSSLVQTNVPPPSPASVPPRTSAPMPPAAPSATVPPPAPLPAVDRPPVRSTPGEESGRAGQMSTLSRAPLPPTPASQAVPPVTPPPPQRSAPAAPPQRPAPPPRQSVPAPSPPPLPVAQPLPPRTPLPPRPLRPVTPPPVRPEGPPGSGNLPRDQAPSLGGVTPNAPPLGSAQDNRPPFGSEGLGGRALPSSPASLAAVQPTRAIEPPTIETRPDQPAVKPPDSLVSLEEEMAKLLGRPVPRREG